MNWTAERLQSLPREAIKILRDNAARLGRRDMLELCDTEIQRRNDQRASASRGAGKVVIGFHFICDRGRRVIHNRDGTLWTGTWVVDETHAETAARIGAYVALHSCRFEPSYLQAPSGIGAGRFAAGTTRGSRREGNRHRIPVRAYSCSERVVRGWSRRKGLSLGGTLRN